MIRRLLCHVLLLAEEGDVYRLPERVREAVEAQYKRDVARVHGGEPATFDDEYKSFIQVLSLLSDNIFWHGGA